MMQPTASSATQQFHMLPACVEELDFDALENGDFQVNDVKDSDEENVIKQLLSSPALDDQWREFFEKIDPDSSVQYTSAPAAGLVFDSAKMSSLNQELRKDLSSVIPLSVQQAQMDNLNSQAISQPDWIQDDVQLSVLLASNDDDDDPAATPPPSSPSAAASLPQLTAPSLSPADQTVPFKRKNSTCSMVSACSEVKRERVSLSESDSTTPFLSTTPHQLFGYSGRRGRPSSDDLNGGELLSDKKLRRREQNRRAATRCRNKRRAEFEQLKKSHEAVMSENEQLKTQLLQLTSQLNRLQHEFAQHLQKCGLALPPNTSL